MDDFNLNTLLGGDIGTDTVNTLDISGDEGIDRESIESSCTIESMDYRNWEQMRNHVDPILSFGGLTAEDVIASPKREVTTDLIMEFTDGRIRKGDDGVTEVKKGQKVNLHLKSVNLSKAKLIRLKVIYGSPTLTMPVHLREERRDPSKPDNVRFQVIRVHVGGGVSYHLEPVQQHCYVEMEVQGRIKGSSFDLPLEFLGLTSEGHGGPSARGWILRCHLLDVSNRIISEGSVRLKSVSELRTKSGQKRSMEESPTAGSGYGIGTDNVKRELLGSRSPSLSPLQSFDFCLASFEAEVRQKYDNKRAKLDEEEQEELDRIRRVLASCI